MNLIQYDATGSMPFDGSNTFTYGDHGRMSTLVSTAGTLTYSYNAAPESHCGNPMFCGRSRFCN